MNAIICYFDGGYGDRTEYGIEYGELSKEAVENIDREFDRVDQNGWCDEANMIVVMDGATNEELLERVKLIDAREFGADGMCVYKEKDRKWAINSYNNI